jgi:hypothetical protein
MGDEAEVLQSVSDLPVQDPPGEEFSAADLRWAKYANSEHHCDDVALIPYDRMEAFISGECNNPEYPTRFHIERSRKRERGTLKEFRSDEYLKYRMYVFPCCHLPCCPCFACHVFGRGLCSLCLILGLLQVPNNWCVLF